MMEVAFARKRRELRWLDAVFVVTIALVARLGVVAWAALRFPPTADGSYYHRVAERISEGLGYTWLWPDGAVTYAAHYPVGYPALVGLAYALVGVKPAAAMALNALVGALAPLAVHRLALRATQPRVAFVAAMLVALHPGLVAYTPALMSEGITASLVTVAAWAAAFARDATIEHGRPPWKRLALLGFVVGAATLVRPQSIVFAPLFALLALFPLLRARAFRGALLGVLLASVAALSVCAPWTLRNCTRMGRCALVSVNGGWNLLIGADPASTGAWSPIKVPDTCREVWDEAGKDECFGRAATLYIVEHPARWLSLVPRKLAATFDYCGAAPWYLHDSNPAACDDRCKLVLGAAETLYERVVLLLALLGTALSAHRRSQEDPASSRSFALKRLSPSIIATAVVVAVGVGALFHTHAWVSYAALAIASLLAFRALLAGPILVSAAIVVLLATMLTHAVFFGAGRYGLVTFPLLTALVVLLVGAERVRAPSQSFSLAEADETRRSRTKDP